MGSRQTDGVRGGGRRRGLAAAFGALTLLALQARAGDAVVLRSIGDDGEGTDRSLAFGSDLDGDERPDLLVGTGEGVRAFSFDSGEVIREYTAAGHPGFLGRGVHFLPDVDGDSVPDVVATAPGAGVSGLPPGTAIVFSGATGEELHRGSGLTTASRFATATVVLGDVTGDGIADLAAGGPGGLSAFAGEIRGFSGADGSAIPWLERTGTGTDNLGYAMAALGDVDADGVPDFVVGSPGAFPRGAAGTPARGRVEAVSGKDGRILRTLKGKALFGYSVADVGDVDGDGRRDFAAVDGLFTRIVVHSSRTFRALRKIPAPPGASSFGDHLSARTGADVDGDGRGDLAVYATVDAHPAVLVYGTATAGLLPVARVDLPQGFFIGHFLLVPDQDGDGIADLAVVEQPFAVRIVRVVPELPASFAFAASLVRPDVDSALDTRGTFSVKVSRGAQTVQVKCAGLPAEGTYTVHLEDGPGAGTFAQVGTLTLRRGSGTLRISGSGAPPAELGVQSLTDLTGRRVQLRDGDGAVLLEALLPLPGARASSSVRLPLLASGGAGSATASLNVRSAARTGSVSFSVQVHGVPAGTPLALRIEDAPGSGTFANAGAFRGTKYLRNTVFGEPLPGGASAYAQLSGRVIQVVSGEEVLFKVLLP